MGASWKRKNLSCVLHSLHLKEHLNPNRLLDSKHILFYYRAACKITYTPQRNISFSIIKRYFQSIIDVKLHFLNSLSLNIL